VTNSLVITLRIVHILTGAAWVGGAFLLLGFVVPRSRQLGSVEGGLFLNRFLDHRWFSAYISAVEGLAILSGLILFWNASGGLQGSWLSTPTGIAFTIGGAAGVIALGFSFAISSALSKLYYLDDEPTSKTKRFADLHARLARISLFYLALLTLAVVAMASAQYLS
jgi:putative copper export protein